jgi:ligand-binding sensor domain-containing protein
VRGSFTRVVGPLTALLVAGLIAAAARAEWKTFGPSDGIFGSTVTALLEDRDQVLWIGTNEGLVRCDGISVRNLAFADLSHGRAMDYIRAIAEDDSGAVWIATNDGVIRMSEAADSLVLITSESTGGGLAGNDVRSLWTAEPGVIWFGSARGLSRLDRTLSAWESFTMASTAGGLPGDQVNAVGVDDVGTVWVGTTSGAASYAQDRRTWRTYRASGTGQGPPSDVIAAVAPDRAGNVWFATDRGVARFSPGGNSWRVFSSLGTAEGPASLRGNAVLSDLSGDVWVATEVGASRYRPLTDRWSNYDRATTGGALSGTTINCLARGSTGRFWLGTFGAGVAMFDGSEWIHHRSGDPLGGPVRDYIHTVAVAPDSVLWVGTARGATCFDGRKWLSFTRSTTGSGLVGDDVQAILPVAAARRIMFGTTSGISILTVPDSTWTTYSRESTQAGLPDDWVTSLLRDSTGGVWAGTLSGLGRFDPVHNSWEGFTAASTSGGLLDERVNGGVCARDGTLWFCTASGVCELDPDDGTWRSFTTGSTEGAIEGQQVMAGLEDDGGNLWFGTDAGITRLNRETGRWESYSSRSTGGGLVPGGVRALCLDRRRRLWAGTAGGGASYFDGTRWVAYASAEQLASSFVYSMQGDRTGRLWFGTADGLTEHTLDLVPPVTVLTSHPPATMSARNVTLAYGAGFADSRGTWFSNRLEDGSWSAWSQETTWSEPGLPDGVHRFAVRARDLAGNVESPGVVWQVEIDASPPVPVIAYPAYGEVVRDSLTVRGEARDSRFDHYSLQVRAPADTSWRVILERRMAVTAGVLGTLDSRTIPDGACLLRLAISDNLGLEGVAQVPIVIDNQFPPAVLTSPATVSALDGGDVYSTDGRVHMAFPPGCFSRDTRVNVDPAGGAAAADAPDTPMRILARYLVSWAAAVLLKPCHITVTQPPDSLRPGETLHLYLAHGSGDLALVGSATERAPATYTAWVEEGGTYLLAAQVSDGGGHATLSSVVVSPRLGIYQPGWPGFAIGFDLSSSGDVTVAIFNRAGRCVARPLSRETRPAGRNTVPWDGRGEDGRVVPAGVYIVAIDTNGQNMRKWFSLVHG